ncbi:hypothetical protein C6497_08110 [Candidatus Poribacteria bacterium]|nr:MAG: hypothetical protein C6497_08110 [Candidatus Poribacteria bacterium]
MKNKMVSHILTLFIIILLTTYFVPILNAQTPTLAQRVFEKYEALLLREDILELIPIVLEELKKPENQELLNPATINLVVDKPDLIETFLPDIDEKFITLLKEDQLIQSFLRDPDVQELLQNPDAIDELNEIIQESLLSLAERIYDRYVDFFEREDILLILPEVLGEIKKPKNQERLPPATIKLVIEDPDLLKTILVHIDEEFITLMKEDVELKTVLSDPDVQLLLQNPDAIDELAVILNIEIIMNIFVKISPSSLESPPVGDLLTITVDIEDGFNVGGYEGILNYDTTALQFVSLEHGTFLTGNVFPVATKVENGQISFAQISTDTIAKEHIGTLVTITFEVINATATELILSDVIIGALGGISLPTVIENAEILEPQSNTPWDVNNDGQVNILDLTFVASYFGVDNPPSNADVNGDGKVNILDLTLIASHFGEQV